MNREETKAGRVVVMKMNIEGKIGRDG